MREMTLRECVAKKFLRELKASERRQEMRRKILVGRVVLTAALSIAAAAFVLCLAQGVVGQETQREVKEIVITVKPRIIVLPQKVVSKVPLRMARIRSTELREINKECNAITIEAVYKLAGKRKKGAEGILSSKGGREVKIDRAGKIRKLLRKEGADKEMIPVKDTYIIQFADYVDEEGNQRTVNLDNAIAAYGALPVVISAGVVDMSKLEASIAQTEPEESAAEEKKPEKKHDKKREKKGQKGRE